MGGCDSCPHSDTQPCVPSVLTWAVQHAQATKPGSQVASQLTPAQVCLEFSKVCLIVIKFAGTAGKVRSQEEGTEVSES